MSRGIGRLAGKSGKTKYTIENATRTRIVIADQHIRILGSFQNIKVARDALCALIMGSPPGKVYSRLRTVTARLAERFQFKGSHARKSSADRTTHSIAENDEYQSILTQIPSSFALIAKSRKMLNHTNFSLFFVLCSLSLSLLCARRQSQSVTRTSAPQQRMINMYIFSLVYKNVMVYFSKFWSFPLPQREQKITFVTFRSVRSVKIS